MLPIHASLMVVLTMLHLVNKVEECTAEEIAHWDHAKLWDNYKYEVSMLMLMIVWCTKVKWEQLTAHKGWKPLVGERKITKAILRRNATHLNVWRNTVRRWRD